MSRQCVKPIVTYVFFDLETTGLLNKKNGYPGIVELSMVAVNRAHFLNATPNELPRVQHRLLLCFNPEMEMTEENVKLSNLTNSLLEQQARFNKNTCEMIKAFINCLPEPVCLVAHNGFEFHYPVLLHRMKLNEADVKPTPMCTDSLYAFYDLYGIEPIVKTKSYSELKRTIFYNFKEEDKYINGKPSISFKLDKIYEREVNLDVPDCSRSQSQSLKMLKIALKKAEKFVDWVDRNHCKLSEVQVPSTVPLYGRRTCWRPTRALLTSQMVMVIRMIRGYCTITNSPVGECPAWAEHRRALRDMIGNGDLWRPALVRVMMWSDAVSSFYEAVMLAKKEAGRMRQ